MTLFEHLIASINEVDNFMNVIDTRRGITGLATPTIDARVKIFCGNIDGSDDYYISIDEFNANFKEIT